MGPRLQLLAIERFWWFHLVSCGLCESFLALGEAGEAVAESHFVGGIGSSWGGTLRNQGNFLDPSLPKQKQDQNEGFDALPFAT